MKLVIGMYTLISMPHRLHNLDSEEVLDTEYASPRAKDFAFLARVVEIGSFFVGQIRKVNLQLFIGDSALQSRHSCLVSQIPPLMDERNKPNKQTVQPIEHDHNNHWSLGISRDAVGYWPDDVASTIGKLQTGVEKLTVSSSRKPKHSASCNTLAGRSRRM